MNVPAAIGIALLTAAAGSKVSAIEIHGRPGGTGDAYALVIGGNWRTACSVEAIEAMRSRFRGDYLWLRRHGTAYIVRDPANLAEAQALFEARDPEWRALEAERRTVARRERALDREQDRAEEDSDALTDTRKRDEASERRRDELEAKRQALDGEIRALDAREQDLDRRSDALERAAEAKLWVVVDRWIAAGAARPVGNSREVIR